MLVNHLLTVLVLLFTTVMKTASQCVNDWIFNDQNERCYHRPDAFPRTFLQAVEICTRLGASPVSVGDPEEADFINTMLRDCVNMECRNSEELYWLGLHRTILNSDFTRDDPIAYNFSNTYTSGGYIQYPQFGWIWLDGTHYDWRYDFDTEMDSMGFNRWSNGQPVSGDPYVRCSVLNDGEWYSANCSSLHRVICEKAASEATTSTIASTLKQSTMSTNTATTEVTTPDTPRITSTASTLTTMSTTVSQHGITSTQTPKTTSLQGTTSSTNSTNVTAVTTVGGTSDVTHNLNGQLASKVETAIRTTTDQNNASAAVNHSEQVENQTSHALMYIVIGTSAGAAIIIMLVIVLLVICRRSSKRQGRKTKYSSVVIRPRPEFGGLHTRSPLTEFRQTTDFDIDRPQSSTLPTTFKNSIRLDETVLNTFGIPMQTDSNGDVPRAPLAQSHSDHMLYSDRSTQNQRMSRGQRSNRNHTAEGGEYDASHWYPRLASEDIEEVQKNLRPIPKYIPIRR